MCEWGTNIPLTVPVPAGLSHTGEARWDVKGVDACLAPLVKALNSAGVYTANCCCGHGKEAGTITLHDGRVLEVTEGLLKMSTQFEYPACRECQTPLIEHDAGPCLDAWVARIVYGCNTLAFKETADGPKFICYCHEEPTHGDDGGSLIPAFSTAREKAVALLDTAKHYVWLSRSNQWARGFTDGPGGVAWRRLRGLGGREMMWSGGFGAPEHMQVVAPTFEHALCLAALKYAYVTQHIDHVAEPGLPVCGGGRAEPTAQGGSDDDAEQPAGDDA